VWADYLRVENLSKHFKGVVAVDGVSFSVKKGELLGIIGPNGAGKTTLFNLITGFLKPSKGRIYFKDKDITKLKPHERVKLGIARTFQLIRPFKNFTVLENVIVAALISKKHGKLDTNEVDFACEVLELVGLEDKKDVKAGNLPHGEMRRLEIARALATKPELLLLDEPFSGLSGEEIASLQNVISDLHAQGLTIILIEHVLKACMSLSERIVVLNYGKIIAEGSPEEICADQRVIEAYLGKRGVEFATG